MKKWRPIKGLSSTVDLGRERLGFTHGNILLPPKIQFPHVEESTIMATADGRVYREYKEGLCTELAREWIRGHWEQMFDCEVVVLEKQMSEWLGHKERSMIVLEQNIKAILDTLYYQGLGPPVVVVKNEWWRDCTGTRVTDGIKRNKRQQYEANKEKSISEFRKHHPDQYVRLVKQFGPVVTDAIESFWIWEAVRLQPQYIFSDIPVNSNHSAVFPSVLMDYGAPQKRIKKEERERGVLSMFDPVTRLYPYDELFCKYTEYKNLCAYKSDVKNNKKKLKSDNKEPTIRKVKRATPLIKRRKIS